MNMGDREEGGKLKVDSSMIYVKINNEDGTSSFFKFRPTSKLEALKRCYCKKESLDYSSVDFIFEDCLLNMEHTANEAGIIDYGEIYAKPLERKSTPRYGSSSTSPNEEEGTGGQEVGNNISNIDDSCTVQGLRKEKTRVLEQDMSPGKTSFEKADNMLEVARKQLADEIKKRAKVERKAKKVIADKDSLIEQLHLEIANKDHTILNLRTDLVEVDTTIRKMRKELASLSKRHQNGAKLSEKQPKKRRHD